MKVEEIEGLDDYFKDMLQKLFGSGQAGVQVPFKVAGGVIDFTEQGWKRVKYIGLDGKEVTFTRTPYLSVVVTGTQGEAKPPAIHLKRIKVDIGGIGEIKFNINIPRLEKITPPRIEIPHVSQIGQIQNIPSIPRISVSKVEVPRLNKFPHITAPEITNTYCFKYKGKNYCYKRRKDFFYNYTEKVFADTLRNKLGDWKVLNWVRDAIINGLVYVEKYLTATIGYLMDVMTGNEVREALQKSLDSITANINRNFVDEINSNLDKFSRDTATEINSTLSSIQDNINNVISRTNANLKEVVRRLNSKIQEFNDAVKQLRDSVQSAINESVSEIVDEYNEKITEAWNKQMEAIQDSILTLVTKINEKLSTIETAVEQGVNIALEDTEKEIENAINIAIAQIWTLIGLAKGVVFQPAVIRNVTNTGFEIYSTGKKTKAYYIVVGV